MKNILFRANSSSKIGTGHIMRDLVLAKKYKAKSKNIIFATEILNGNINYKIEEAGYKIESLKSNGLNELIKVIKKHSIDFIVIDSYDIDWKFERELKKRVKIKILSFDDTYEKHYCDILLNHNISAKKERYKNLVPKRCKLKCGSKYTLIRDEFYREKSLKRIFVAMGGADLENINLKILKLLREFKNIEVNLVTTKANPNIKSLEKFAKKYPFLNLHINSNELAKLMKISDFAIVSPSVIVHEVLFMNLPFIAIKTADNQNYVYKYLKEKKCLVLDRFKKQELFFTIVKLNSFQYIAKKIEFKNLSYNEKVMVLNWRNDKRVRFFMLNKEKISFKKHLNFIESLKNRKDKKYFLIKMKNLNLGVIDFVNINKSSAYLGLYSNPNLKIKGIGSFLMREIIREAFENLKLKVLKLEVKSENKRAISLYKKFNFQEIKKKSSLIEMELKYENRKL